MCHMYTYPGDVCIPICIYPLTLFMKRIHIIYVEDRRMHIPAHILYVAGMSLVRRLQSDMVLEVALEVWFPHLRTISLSEPSHLCGGCRVRWFLRLPWKSSFHIFTWPFSAEAASVVPI